jgi:hypothetical protein
MTIPYGETSFTELKTIYKNKIAASEAENKAAFMLDGITLLSDLRAAVLECRKTGKPVYVMLSVDDELLTENELPADIVRKRTSESFTEPRRCIPHAQRSSYHGS